MAGDPVYEALGYWLLLTGAVGFVSMGVDKFRAVHQERRIPEKTLLWIALLGGSLGTLVGGLAFNHKTAKLRFFLPLVVITAIWLAALLQAGFLGCLLSV